MISAARRPDTLAVAVTLIASVAVLATSLFGLLMSRNKELGDAERQLQHFAVMLAEHSARSIDGIDILLREVARDLSRQREDWRNWDDRRGWEYVAERHTRSLSQLRDLGVFDDSGRMRFVSRQFPAPALNIADRTYFQALGAGAESASFGPYVGRSSGRYAYGMGTRISGFGGGFSGIVYATLEIAYFQEFCWPIRPHDNFDALIVNNSGQVIASCRPVDLSAQSPVLGRRIAEIVLEGRLGEISVEPGQHRQHGALLSVVALPSHPELRVVAVLPEAAALAGWKQRIAEFGILAALILVVIVVGGWFIRRQVVELAATSGKLAQIRQELEQRVRNATEKIEQQKEEAIRGSTAKSRFLAAASHDLRQPLHALSLFAADLQRQVTSGHTRDLDRLARQINSSVVSLAEMLDALLDISRLDMGGVQPDPSSFPVQSVFDRLQLSFRRAAMSKRIGLRIRPSSWYVLSDIHLVERLVGNLLSNAIRYTPDGGRVMVATRRRGDRVVIEVRDNGLGIAPEHQQMIFKEFFQVGNIARDQKQGLGLGLAIVQRIARTLGAQIGLRSRVGAGTVFSVALPLSDGAVEIKQGTAPALLVCGNEADTLHAAELASGWGYDCRAADEMSVEDWLVGDPAVVLCSAAQAIRLRAALPPAWVVVAIGATATAPGLHAVQLPVRPARLRALLQQLQNTLSKSML